MLRMSVDLTLVPTEKRAVLESAVAALQNVPHVAGVVLGGSYSCGCAGESSDLDIGIYYRESRPLPIEAIRAVAASISIPGSTPLVTDLYGWGPWVNGGAWIHTAATKVDFVYRNLDQLERVIQDGHRGVTHHDFEQQPPYGFRSVIYFAETYFCIPLYDPHGEIRKCKGLVATYPAPLRTSIVHNSLWGAEFSLWACDGFARSGDVLNVAGCLTRTADYLVQAIFALNRLYFLNHKHANRMLSDVPVQPYRVTQRLSAVLARIGADRHELTHALHQMLGIWSETVALTNGEYQSRFDMSSAKAR